MTTEVICDNTIQLPSKKRYTQIDILKAVCAFMVVCIHIQFPGKFGACFKDISRIAVPIFFIITGFFYFDIVKKNSQLKQIKKICCMILFANLLFFIAGILAGILNGSGVVNELHKLNLHSLIIFIFFNESPFSGHLWYLNAVCYTLIAVYFANKSLKGMKILYCLTPILLLADLALGKYSLVLLGIDFKDVFYVRNFLFVGIPYFCLGNIIRKLNDRNRLNIKKSTLIILIVIFSLTTLFESYILGVYNMSATREHYISTTPLSILVFIYFLSEDFNYLPNFIIDKLSCIGRDFSALIYIVHPLLIAIVGKFHNQTALFEPIIVYVLSIVSVMCFKYFLSKIKNLKTKHQF